MDSGHVRFGRSQDVLQELYPKNPQNKSLQHWSLHGNIRFSSFSRIPKTGPGEDLAEHHLLRSGEHGPGNARLQPCHGEGLSLGRGNLVISGAKLGGELVDVEGTWDIVYIYICVCVCMCMHLFICILI